MYQGAHTSRSKAHSDDTLPTSLLSAEQCFESDFQPEALFCNLLLWPRSSQSTRLRSLLNRVCEISARRNDLLTLSVIGDDKKSYPCSETTALI